MLNLIILLVAFLGNASLCTGLKFAWADVHQPAPDQFTTTVRIGTPPQEFTVLIDLDNALLWVPDVKCGAGKCADYCKEPAWCTFLCASHCCAKTYVASPASGDCGARRKFNSAQSSTYKKNGTKFEEEDPKVEGFIGIDAVTFSWAIWNPNARVKVVTTFGQALATDFDDSIEYDGVLGLALATDAPAGSESLLRSAYRQGLLAKPIWTLWLQPLSKNLPWQPVGRIVYGIADGTNCGPVDYFDVEPFGERGFLIPLFGISLGGYEARAPAKQAFAADLDLSSTNVIRGSSTFIKPLASAVGAVRNSDGTYTVSCQATIPPLILEFARGHKYEISADELVVKDASGSCRLNIAEGFEAAEPPLFVVGSPLARVYCTVHDVENQRFGVAKPSPNATIY